MLMLLFPFFCPHSLFVFYHIEKTGQVSCVQCLPGHRGSLCKSCTAGYQWTDDKCTPLNCLSNTLCAEQRNAPGCEDCIFLENKFPSNAYRSNAGKQFRRTSL